MNANRYLAAKFSLAVTLTAAAIADSPRWCFDPLDADAPPERSGDWARTPIDDFVLAKLEERKLRPQPEADRHTLIRRLTAGLTGLPPTIEEIDAFILDQTPDAYNKLVDRLLASSHFGERWGRHWLDVARFGESNGTLTVNEDKVRSDAWRYRDAVIRAVNADLPFDRFVKYQLGGVPASDEAAAEFRELKRFLELGTRLQNNANPNDRQFHRLDDMVSTTGSAFLGLTFGCARCHDHPVDPMSTAEYYQFTAIFFDQVVESPKASKKEVPLVITEPRVLKAGSWSSPQERVDPGFLKALMGSAPGQWLGEEKSGLESLGDWLADAEHGAGQQLARVIVNRLWHHHFGRGLVSTPNDFGALGSRPTHPRLLDWLAARLIESGWRLKPLHRLILTSAVYRQAGATETAALESDAENAWMWHWRPRRLEAEAIRDRMLNVAGELRTEMFGPSIPIGSYKQEVREEARSWRRSIYLQAHRSARHPTLSLFDPPDTERSVGARSTGASPEGALFALNAPFVWELAERFAKRVEAEVGEDPASQIRHAWLLAFSRPVLPEELDIGLEFLRGQRERALVDYCHLILGLNEFIYIH